ncbi:hypothetical protein FB388_4312 [Pseudonocardia cypriaca]|uniref:Uncharacterized protein n=1 Tax=Pseudonocardia cypriaca TaxID=882449 RepID=A0A543FTF3_9PSEU|nr:hypothetical protein FB388_4312 [Pseudonocardia cypriaca]
MFDLIVHIDARPGATLLTIAGEAVATIPEAS